MTEGRLATTFVVFSRFLVALFAYFWLHIHVNFCCLSEISYCSLGFLWTSLLQQHLFRRSSSCTHGQHAFARAQVCGHAIAPLRNLQTIKLVLDIHTATHIYVRTGRFFRKHAECCHPHSMLTPHHVRACLCVQVPTLSHTHGVLSLILNTRTMQAQVFMRESQRFCRLVKYCIQRSHRARASLCPLVPTLLLDAWNPVSKAEVINRTAYAQVYRSIPF